VPSTRVKNGLRHRQWWAVVASFGVLNPAAMAVPASTNPATHAPPASESIRSALTDLDALRYIASHADLIAAFGTDIARGRKHYEDNGIKEGRQITFDPLRYIASHPDLILAFGLDEDKAVRHYINFGFNEKRSTTRFDAGNYLARYADLRATFGKDLVAATKHYIGSGFAEGRSYGPLLNVDLELTVDKPVVSVGGSAVIGWKANNSTDCTASGAWSGARATSGQVTLTAGTPGRYDYVLECRGEGASARRSITLAVTYPVFATSYENKNSLSFDETQVPHFGHLGIKQDADERSGSERAVTFGDFAAEGRIGAFVGVHRFRNVHGLPKDVSPADSPGKGYFLIRDDSGQWVDRSNEFFASASDRDTCVTLSSAITADFNNDRKPDIFLSCQGMWYPLPNGENNGNHPRYPEIYMSNQVLFLSTTGKTYRRVELPYRLISTHASAADLNGDGHIDIALTNHSQGPETKDPDFVRTPVLLGRGDGTFTKSDSIIPRDDMTGRRLEWDRGWTTSIHLIPIDGRLDLVMSTGSGAVWIQGQRGGGFDPGSLKFVRMPLSPRVNERYSVHDVVLAGGSFFLTGSAYSAAVQDHVILKTDFESPTTYIFPGVVNEPPRNIWYHSASQIKLSKTGALVAYTHGCSRPPTGMCGLRLTDNSLQTLSDLDTLNYIASHPDLIQNFGTDISKGRLHFEQWGAREGRKITFNPLIYTASHPDLILAFGADEEKAVRHYINFGSKEKRVSSAFDPLRYTASHGDLIARFGFDTVAATRDYILNGYRDGRVTTFDGWAYIASHPDLIESLKTDVVAAIKHFIRYGFEQGRRITFDALAYIASHVDLLTSLGADAVAGARHYITAGYKEGRRVTFSVAHYLANHADLRAAFGTNKEAAIRHYISVGFAEKRAVARSATTPTTRLDAHRFLVQATFGPRAEDITRLLETGYGAKGYERWIDDQIRQSVSLQLPTLVSLVQADKKDMGPAPMQNDRVNLWFRNVLLGDDQLRQRVAWALSQVMVVSDNGALLDFPFAIADFHDMLARNAFGNFRRLLEDVTLHPAMGMYLSMLGNQKAVEGTNLRPDENYAREMMQLFSIGLVELNIDGSVRRDATGQPIPTYNQQTIQGFARVFTGWGWSCPGYVLNAGRSCTVNDWRGFDQWPVNNFNQVKPMQLYPEQHEAGEKQLLVYPGVALPGGKLPALQGGARDLSDALDNVFRHPNVGPFISKQLIQKLVTSNPSPDYVRRVAEIFNNDGAGVRGNLEAVIKAILLDPEARALSESETAGKVKEPLLRLTQLWRAYAAKAPSGKINTSSFCCPVAGPSPVHIFGQSPGQSPSVFNFFSPSYAPPGEIARMGLVAPELQLANENLHTQMDWFFFVQAHHRTSRQVGQGGLDNFYIDIAEEMKIADGVDDLLDFVGAKLLGSAEAMSPALRQHARAQLRRWKIDPTMQDAPNFSRQTHIYNMRQNRVSEAIYLIVTSPDYAVQR